MKKYLALFLGVLVLNTACNHFTISIPKPTEYPVLRPKQMVAGIAQSDLTPPPGYPMAGYSINGRISRGYWVCPKATALYLRDTAGTPFVFVTTDLWAITEGQKLAVLQLLEDDPTTSFIGESELLLAATHAHQSLGVNVPDDAFSLSSIGFGFDTTAFRFTVGQIAAAIRMAVNAAQPANITFAMGRVTKIAKNRSVQAYLRNNVKEREQYYKQEPKLHQMGVTSEELSSMIDQRLTILTVKDLTGKTKGILASYPVHPTATGDETEVYSADIFGLASSYASGKITDEPIIAFYNGAEGDVAPDYLYHNRYDAVNIAKKLSDGIVQLLAATKPIVIEGPIIHKTNRIDIASKKVEYNVWDENCYDKLPHKFVWTAKNPVEGTSLFAGASDGRTSLSSFGISDGAKSKKWDAKQGYKTPAVNFFLSNILHVKKPFSQILNYFIKTKPMSVLPISIHEVGPVRFVGIPGEFTTMLGRRIRKTIVDQSADKNESTISLVGLADSYISYVTTPCEYNEQAYEGASNYFGISTGQVFLKAYQDLAARGSADEKKQRGKVSRFKVGTLVSFGPPHLEELQTWDAEEKLQNLLFSANGRKLHSHIIPPDVYEEGTIDIAGDEAVAFSFDDTVITIGNNKDFYPIVTLETSNGKAIPMADYILTIDKYAEGRATWTVRLLDISCLWYTDFHFAVKLLRGKDTIYSACFRKQKCKVN